MEQDEVTGYNDLFLGTLLGMILVSRDFRSVVLDGLWEMSQYPFDFNGSSGYVRMDFSNIDDKNVFREAIMTGLLGKAALKLPHRPQGDLHERTSATVGSWKFTFVITQYERDRSHDWEMVNDPLPLPEGENLGRLIVMQVEQV